MWNQAYVLIFAENFVRKYCSSKKLLKNKNACFCDKSIGKLYVRLNLFLPV